MKRLSDREALSKLREKIAGECRSDRQFISVSAATCGRARGAHRVVEALKEASDGSVEIKVTGCHGFCEAEPNLIVFPQEIFYQKVSPEDAEEILRRTIDGGDVVERLLYRDVVTGKTIVHQQDIPFYGKQFRLLLRSNPLIDPSSIDDYIALGGYESLAKILDEDPADVIETIKKAGLRGRGGGGFPTGKKWEIARNARGDLKYVVCNADEGDPGAYMDRSLLESNPHSVVEGMAIGAYAIGASEGWIYVRGEYPLAVERTEEAIEEARTLGLLGDKILGSEFSFNVQISTGAGAFVCGEETALIASIEGKRGMPRQRPPFPVLKGLFGKPTNINNVETWANVPTIVDRGPKWYSGIGTETSKGTKIFSLVGKVKNTGLVEVPMGISLREVIFDIGGGMLDGSQFKAVQTGGPSGGCIPGGLLDLPVDYESLTGAGSIMGSGGMIIMDEKTCMVDVARYFLNFLKDESCGRCLPCRKGVQKLHEIVSGIAEGRGREEDLETLEELGQVIRDTSLCGLGQTAPNPLLATLRYFRDEYLAHIREKRCEAAVCKEIVSAPCQHVCPIDQEASAYIALVAKDRLEEAAHVVRKDNPLAAVLSRVCHHPCEVKCRAGESGDPIDIRSIKRFITDHAMEKGITAKAEAPVNGNGSKVAVVGAGPAGLICAHYLSLKGYDVTVFEKRAVAGGMLAVGIPEYRLPRALLKADLDYVTSPGMTIKTGMSLGEDFSLDDLQADGYKAVFVAIGAYESSKLGIENESIRGVLPAMEILEKINSGQKVDIGKRVGIVGGGNAAVDTARSLVRTGIPEKVTIYYRRTTDEMPAFKEEVEAALEEGIEVEFLTSPVRIVADGGGLAGCEFNRMELGELDESGRRRPVPIAGSEFTVELDSLIVAIGERPESQFMSEYGVELTKWKTVVADSETLKTKRDGLFAGGDLVLGPSTVVEACAHGKISAQSIHLYLSDKEITRTYGVTRPSTYVEPVELSDEELSVTSRGEMRRLPIGERRSGLGEVELGYEKTAAVREARRCLRCELETSEGQAFLEEIKAAAKEA
jgi:NADH-quinone oxidoreductase subunit F